jgi:predicted N-acetyltransferase YhbS
LGALRLREVPPDVYAREVLPLTAPLWAGRRSLDEYVAQTLEIARGPYGRRYYRTLALLDDGTPVASFKRYERTVRSGSRRLRAVGFGAVFTPTEYRGRGYASLMLAMALDRARSERLDLAYLFSDIRPQFYAAVGFRALPSREFSLRADSLPAARLPLARFTDDDWSAVRRVFERCARRCAAGFLRSSAVWDWIATRARQGSEHRSGGAANFLVRRRGRVAAYVFGVRDPARDAYVLDEFGYTDDAAEGAVVPALLRAAAGDLQRIIGWLPPAGMQSSLPKRRVRKRSGAILMMAPLSAEGERLVRALVSISVGDFSWPTDHI